ncbi:MAG: 30S ribosomal protein S20 [Rhodospirillales bacterium]|jgi:small subunit ribosomal protein S20|nr:30S ribosomal protein S20 [Rhodospirillales bacterium]
MANSPQSKKRVRQTERRTEVNRNRRSRMRGYVRGVEEAIESGNSAAAKEAFLAAEPQLMRSAQKGLVHKNAASRKVSRLSARIKAMA